MPSDWALWAPTRVFPPDGLAEGLSKEEDFFLNVMPSSHTPFLTHHGGKQAAKKRIWKYKSLLISHVRCHILVDCCSVESCFVVFLVVVAKLWHQGCFRYVVRSQIDLGSWSTVVLKTLLPFMELGLAFRVLASFYSSDVLLYYWCQAVKNILVFVSVFS